MLIQEAQFQAQETPFSAYDPGTITKTFANVGGGTHQVRKRTMEQTPTSTATFGLDSLNDPLNVNLNLNSPTFTYSQANVGTSLTVTANAAYTINPVHSARNCLWLSYKWSSSNSYWKN